MTLSRAYPVTPLIGVSVLCVQDNAVLMVQRGKQPYKGYWSLPGGLIETGETISKAATRELKEETGFHAITGQPLDIFEIIQADDTGQTSTHFIIVIVPGQVTAGSLHAGDDAQNAQWVSLADISKRQTTPGTCARIQKLLPRLAEIIFETDQA